MAGPGLESGYFGLVRNRTIHVRRLGAGKTLCGRVLNLWQFCGRGNPPPYLEPWHACKTCRRIALGWSS